MQFLLSRYILYLPIRFIYKLITTASLRYQRPVPFDVYNGSDGPRQYDEALVRQRSHEGKGQRSHSRSVFFIYWEGLLFVPAGNYVCHRFNAMFDQRCQPFSQIQPFYLLTDMNVPMKSLLVGLCCLLTAGCTTTRFSAVDAAAQALVWEENPVRSLHDVAFGVPAIQQTKVTYRRNGKTEFRIHFGKPQLITVADKPQPWGYYQFPTLTRLVNGDLHAQWAMHPDDIRAYGLAANGSSVSSDGGRTWQPITPDSSQLAGYPLPNGDLLRVVDPRPVQVTELAMPASLGKTAFKYRKTNFTFYRLKDMPNPVKGIYLTRKRAGQTQWKAEQAQLDDARAVRYSSKELVPVVWWGDLHTLADSSLLAGVYPSYYLQDNGQVDKQMGVVFHRSRDGGHSWQFQGRIPFQADASIDSMATERIGFSEPTYEVLADGSLLCVIRSADGDGVTNGVGNGPLYASRSYDQGRNWTKPVAIAPAGALPRLLRLANGITVLSSGRPGVQLRFMKSGVTQTWTDGFEMLPYESKQLELQYLVSCGYTGLLATGPNRFLVIYSDFRYKNELNQERKAIKIREVTVNPRQ
ncbi:sialidase family protein [Spirosoma validum]|uniref:Exo-alpha-sialidase n=1 Tax=Spirosoma validum TaxID=2771355 RepID=A0A927B1X6_9BACT|nr:sialidase family protein [Spirosoma validum]MBD2753900.1 exo-alpha-sialidase [Spirosoma validum]